MAVAVVVGKSHTSVTVKKLHWFERRFKARASVVCTIATNRKR